MKTDYTRAKLDAATRALMDYAWKLTRAPWEMTRSDVDALRAKGFSDAAVLDAAEIVGWFNYINRVADGLGVDLEPEMQPPHA